RLPVLLDHGLPGGERLGERGEVRDLPVAGGLGEVAVEHAEQRAGGAAHAQPGAGHGGDPAAVVGRLLPLELAAEVRHGGADVVAEVAVAGAAVEVAERAGGLLERAAEGGDDVATEVVGQGGGGHRRSPHQARAGVVTGASQRRASSSSSGMSVSETPCMSRLVT